MTRNRSVFEINIQQILMLVFVFIALGVIADPPEKRPITNMVFNPAVDAATGDFLADTINVFEIAKDVSQIFAEAIKYTSLNDIYGDTAYLHTLFTSDYSSNDLAEAYKNDVKARIRAQRGDLGVDLNADYVENFTPGFSYDEQITYKRRVFFGIEWNMINGGFLESRAKIGQLKKEYGLKDVDAKKLEDAENYRYIFNYINYIFNKQKIDVMHERYTLIEQQLKFTTELYHLRYVGWEKVLKVRAKLEDLDQQIAQMENFNQHIPNNIPDALVNSKYTAESLPLVDIDLDKLMHIYHNNETNDTIAAIKLAMYSSGMKWWQDISLKPYMRYNVYQDEFGQSRSYGSGGVSLKLPLRINSKGKRVDAKKAIFEAEGMSETRAGDNELVNHYAEFAFKLKQIKEFYYKKLFADELIRKELVKKDYKDIGFNPIFTLGLIDDKKNIESEIIDIKKLLYIQLVQMAFYLDEKSPLSFTEILNPNDFTSRYSTGVQLFVDKTSFERMGNNELVNYLWKNEFRDIVLEVDSWDLSSKVLEAIEKASKDHIYFTLNMKIPEGQTYPDVNRDLQELRKIDNKYINGLHYSLNLNKDRSNAREVQEVNFSDWVNGIDISNKSKDIRLSITIGDDLPMNILNKVYNTFDLVFVPSDGAPNRQKLEEKLIQELSLGKNKLTVVLDANDFADRLHLENYMANINKETGVENFAFSNIENMMHADMRTFEMGELNKIGTDDIMATFRNQIYNDEQRAQEKLRSNFDPFSPIGQNGNDLNKPVSNTANNTASANASKVNQNIQNEVVQRASANPAGKTWQIQIAASKVSLSDSYLKNKFNINEIISTYRVNGYYKYTVKSFKNENEARAALINYKSQSGNTGAFVVSYE